ncbi:hypothetical protein [Tenacibaculum amylolyticum]|uniref:hypothetical protein n=1 Tax=Tenacibaculum amylolyticum TaxID=104269 RepID=UPI003892E7EC
MKKTGIEFDSQKRRKEEPLTNEELLTFFILQFFTPKSIWRNDHFSESEMDRFKKHGFNRKIKQAKTVRVLGIIFWFLVFFIVIF